MRPIYIKYSDVINTDATSGWVVLDQYVAPGNVAVTVKLTQKTADPVAAQVFAYFTNDDVFDPDLNGNFASQPYTASPFNSAGIWTVTGLTEINSVVVAEAMFAYAPRAVRMDLSLTSGQVDFETQVVQLGVSST